MTTPHDHVLLVGSVPLETAANVSDVFGAPLGEHLCSMPDGAVGPRSHWISRLHYQCSPFHPGLEVGRQPRPEDGAERLNPRGAGDGWKFRVRPLAEILHDHQRALEPASAGRQNRFRSRVHARTGWICSRKRPQGPAPRSRG